MSWVAGADGCRAGWIRAGLSLRTGELRFDLVASASELITGAPRVRVLGLDIPVGLPDAGARECDRAARGLLGPGRSSSVFPAPIRPALAAGSREQASRITERADGRRVSVQAWGIAPKIREVDALLRSHAAARRVICEVHPEVSFWAWNGERPLVAGKRSRAGRRQRQRLVERWLGTGVLARARGCHRRSELADDDILDAVAALWSAERIARGVAKALPARPPRDAAGLPMRIVY